MSYQALESYEPKIPLSVCPINETNTITYEANSRGNSGYFAKIIISPCTNDVIAVEPDCPGYKIRLSFIHIKFHHLISGSVQQRRCLCQTDDERKAAENAGRRRQVNEFVLQKKRNFKRLELPRAATVDRPVSPAALALTQSCLVLITLLAASVEPRLRHLPLQESKLPLLHGSGRELGREVIALLSNATRKGSTLPLGGAGTNPAPSSSGSNHAAQSPHGALLRGPRPASGLNTRSTALS